MSRYYLQASGFSFALKHTKKTPKNQPNKQTKKQRRDPAEGNRFLVVTGTGLEDKD